MNHIDNQLKKYSHELVNEVGIDPIYTNNLASIIYNDSFKIKIDDVEQIRNASPVQLKDRYDELLAFQNMSELLINFKEQPHLRRAQILCQNYFCFVYLKDNYLKSLEKIYLLNSPSQRACKYLISAEIKKFRNSIAHGNWKYKSDFSGFEFWDFENAKANPKLVRYEVNEHRYNFWQTLSKAVAYASLTGLLNRN